MRDLRLIILDKNVGVRRPLARRLECVPGLQIVGSTSDAAEAMAQVRDLNPDLVLFDVRMEHGMGWDLCRQIAAVAPERTRVAVLTSYGDVSDKREAMNAGACGFLLKDLDTKRLVRQILRLACAGRGATEGGPM